MGTAKRDSQFADCRRKLVELRCAIADINDPGKIAERTREYEERFLNPFVAAQRGYLDEVILPHSTRRRIARGLRSLRNKRVEMPWKKHDNIPL